MICQNTFAVSISWSLSKFTRARDTALANIKPVSCSLPLGDIGRHAI
jgi:hypothetical protein